MRALIDFDNVDNRRFLRGGLVDLVDQLITFGSNRGWVTENALHIRLYGGWDKGGNLISRAQDLASSIRGSFPRIFNLTPRLRVTVGLAFSTEAYPQHNFSHTLRTEGLASGIVFQQPTKVACRNPSCPIETLFPFFRDKKCPDAACSTSPNSIASQTTQKMVDTMIVADLIHNAFAGDKNLWLVSNDDDMWPGILTALRAGATIRHFMPRSTEVGMGRYLPAGTDRYEGASF